MQTEQLQQLKRLVAWCDVNLISLTHRGFRIEEIASKFIATFLGESEALLLTMDTVEKSMSTQLERTEEDKRRPRRRVLTGMRTTGRLHLGHYVGALKSWLALQGEYECYFLLADIQALTTHFDRASSLEESVRQVVIDWLSVGLDPERSSFLVQSWIREYHELTTYLTFLVSMGELEKNPTLKEEIKAHGMETVNLGFMMYPVSQASDILLFSPEPSVGGELIVSVGADQIPHIELARDIARAFNAQYGETFMLPATMVGEVPRLADLQGSGRKMGKSYGNAIFLSDSRDVVAEKVRFGQTDPKKIRKGDPGDPAVCPIYSYHAIFNKGNAAEISEGCKSGRLGCVECKTKLAGTLNEVLDPIREKRTEIEQHPERVAVAVQEGTTKGSMVGRKTIARVRSAMYLEYPTLTDGNIYESKKADEVT